MTFTYHPSDLEIMARAKRYNAWLGSLIKPYIGASAIEIGAGTGNIASLYASKLQRGVLLEPDPAGYSVLSKMASENNWIVSVYNNDLHGYLDLIRKRSKQMETFHTALYINVLEHIEDDILELTSVRSILKPGGRLIIYVPAYPWLYSAVDRAVGHYRRYTKASLTKKITEAGFKITTIKYVNLIGIPGWIINRFSGRTTQSTSLIVTYDRLITPFINLFDAMVIHSIGLSLFVVAERLP